MFTQVTFTGTCITSLCTCNGWVVTVIGPHKEQERRVTSQLISLSFMSTFISLSHFQKKLTHLHLHIYKLDYLHITYIQEFINQIYSKIISKCHNGLNQIQIKQRRPGSHLLSHRHQSSTQIIQLVSIWCLHKTQFNTNLQAGNDVRQNSHFSQFLFSEESILSE